MRKELFRLLSYDSADLQLLFDRAHEEDCDEATAFHYREKLRAMTRVMDDVLSQYPQPNDNTQDETIDV